MAVLFNFAISIASFVTNEINLIWRKYLSEKENKIYNLMTYLGSKFWAMSTVSMRLVAILRINGDTNGYFLSAR